LSGVCRGGGRGGLLGDIPALNKKLRMVCIVGRRAFAD
jgi:hypothetical protein